MKFTFPKLFIKKNWSKKDFGNWYYTSTCRDELSSLVVNFNKRLTSVFDWCATYLFFLYFWLYIFVRFARFSNRIYFDDNAPLSLRTQPRTRVVESVNPVACFLTKEFRYNRTITISETYNT